MGSPFTNAISAIAGKTDCTRAAQLLELNLTGDRANCPRCARDTPDTPQANSLIVHRERVECGSQACPFKGNAVDLIAETLQVSLSDAASISLQMQAGIFSPRSQPSPETVSSVQDAPNRDNEHIGSDDVPHQRQTRRGVRKQIWSVRSGAVFQPDDTLAIHTRDSIRYPLIGRGTESYLGQIRDTQERIILGAVLANRLMLDHLSTVLRKALDGDTDRRRIVYSLDNGHADSASRLARIAELIRSRTEAHSSMPEHASLMGTVKELQDLGLKFRVVRRSASVVLNAQESIGSNASIARTHTPDHLGDHRVLRSAMLEYKRVVDQLVCSSLRLVSDLALRYVGRGVEYEDLLQNGYLGLFIACERFDASAGTKLSTYATWWIRQMITRCLVESVRLIRLPSHMHQTINGFYREQSDTFKQTGVSLTLDEYADRESQSGRYLEHAHLVSKEIVPLSAIHYEQIERDSYCKRSANDPTERCSTDELTEIIRRVIDRFAPRDRHILRHRFGLEGIAEMTLEELGDLVGVTRERVRQIESKLLEKLRYHPSIRRLVPTEWHPPAISTQPKEPTIYHAVLISRPRQRAKPVRCVQSKVRDSSESTNYGRVAEGLWGTISTE